MHRTLHSDLYPITLVIHPIYRFGSFMYKNAIFWVFFLSRTLNFLFMPWLNWLELKRNKADSYTAHSYLGGAAFNISPVSMMGFLQKVPGLLGLALFPVRPILSADRAPLINSSKVFCFPYHQNSNLIILKIFYFSL